MTGIRCEALKVSLRDDDSESESNCWMSEDAFGYVSEEEQTVVGCRWDNFKRQKILIVDDINDTGATFNWIKEDWTSGCLPMEHDAWNTVWNGDQANVRFATLIMAQVMLKFQLVIRVTKLIKQKKMFGLYILGRM